MTAGAPSQVDLGAITENVRALRAIADTPLLAVVKADGYGHGAVPVARAALAGGADLLGVAYPVEALALRERGVDAPLLAWLWTPDEDVSPALAAGVVLGVSSVEQLDRVRGARVAGTAVHLKVDTGLGRGGAGPADWVALCRSAADAERAGELVVDGVMSHLGSSEVVG